MTVVVIGDLMADVVAAHDAPLAHGSDTPAHTVIGGGGAGGNVAAWLAHAGVPAALIGRVGNDAFADAALAGLDDVDLRIVRVDGPTGVCVVLVDGAGERTMLPDAGANAGLGVGDLPADLFVAGNVLYLSGYTLLRAASRDAALDGLARARARGMRIVLDAASAAPLRAAPDFAAWAGRVDVLLANADEAKVLGDRMEAAAVVIKRGAAGASWAEGSGTVTHPAEPARIVDTTGAGDAFAAGLLSAWPGPPLPALAAATRLAAEAVAVRGGRPR